MYYRWRSASWGRGRAANIFWNSEESLLEQARVALSLPAKQQKRRILFFCKKISTCAAIKVTDAIARFRNLILCRLWQFCYIIVSTKLRAAANLEVIPLSPSSDWEIAIICCLTLSLEIPDIRQHRTPITVLLNCIVSLLRYHFVFYESPNTNVCVAILW